MDQPTFVLRGGKSAILLSCVLAVQFFLPVFARAAGPAPGHLDIREAVLIEQEPMDPADVAARGVVMRIAVVEAPSCTAGTGFLSYGLLIDSDRNPVTGAAPDEFKPLGIDARISLECDPGSGTFTSPLGTVSVSADPGTGFTLLELSTTVGQLPSVNFFYLAYAQEDATLTRLPEPSDFGAWKTIEQFLP
jgi:hypothetical protein